MRCLPLTLLQTFVCINLMVTGWLFTSTPCVLGQESRSGATAGPDREQFIPVDQMDTLFARDRAGVLMPREQFRELLQRAQQNAEAQADLPTGVIVEHADVHVEPVDQHALIRMKLHIRQ